MRTPGGRILVEVVPITVTWSEQEGESVLISCVSLHFLPPFVSLAFPVAAWKVLSGLRGGVVPRAIYNPGRERCRGWAIHM